MDCIIPNIPSESQRNTTDPSVTVTDSSAADYDSSDESLVCSTPLPPLKKLDGAEPITGPKSIKLILRGEALQAKKAESLKSTTAESLNANRSKTPTKKDLKWCLEMTLHAQLKVMAPSNFDEKRGTIFNSYKEIVMIVPRVRDVYVLDMTSSAQESCFFAKASDNLKWIWHTMPFVRFINCGLCESNKLNLLKRNNFSLGETVHIVLSRGPK
ncbi:hypothetical protein Tco_0780044 [Tanacetum coccineum]